MGIEEGVLVRLGWQQCSAATGTQKKDIYRSMMLRKAGGGVRLLCSWACFVVSMLMFVVEHADAQRVGRGKEKPRARNRSDGSSRESFWLGIRWVVFLIVLMLVPPIAYFAYSVAKDPDTPTLVTNILALGREKLLGNLSKKQKKKKERKNQ